ncbi:LysR family transcriptional regulator [Catenovulum sediminis]|uniref:LysR family transcriptional regulator n=1 Tax=Catenovulum sediminis TaxID=1740262 RepID=A0ABV1RMB5_9ALTE|nr:LysR family transcriptional regulator [Catenovulum sediminis]
MQVSLQALKAFESAARRGSFKLAAEELSLTPTAISHHINNLEGRLNVSLFKREARSVTLTEVGRRLAIATSDGFAQIERALEEIKLSGYVVRVTTTSSLAALVLLPSLKDFSLSNPNISVEVSTGESLDSLPYVIPVRFGDASTVQAGDIVKCESFDVYGAYGMQTPSWSAKPITIFSTEWKNSELPAPPLKAWLAKNGVEQANITVKKFDQEFFGIQQAMAENELVFCSTTLAKRLLKTKQLQHFGTHSVESELCYYVAKKAHFEGKNARIFLSWLDKLLMD